MFNNRAQMHGTIVHEDYKPLPRFATEEDGNEEVVVATIEEKIPLFLKKLWNIVDDATYYDIIRWDESGYSFHIMDPYMFCRNVLPQFFKHNNITSLIRQLNMYGFRKITPIERSSLARAKSDQDHLEFSHPYFNRDRPELLVNIKRKQPIAKPQVATGSPEPLTSGTQPKELSSVVDEIKLLRERQKTMEVRMNDLMKENEMVWGEMAHIKGVHLKQQQMVNKLIQLLVALVQPNKQQRIGKRHMLGLDDYLQDKRSRSSTTIQELENAVNDVIQQQYTPQIEDAVQPFVQNEVEFYKPHYNPQNALQLQYTPQPQIENITETTGSPSLISDPLIQTPEFVVNPPIRQQQQYGITTRKQDQRVHYAQNTPPPMQQFQPQQEIQQNGLQQHFTPISPAEQSGPGPSSASHDDYNNLNPDLLSYTDELDNMIKDNDLALNNICDGIGQDWDKDDEWSTLLDFNELIDESDKPNITQS